MNITIVARKGDAFEKNSKAPVKALADAGLIPLSEASDRFEKLKKTKFNP